MKFKFTLFLSILSGYVAFSQTSYSSDTVAVTATECNSNEYKAEIQMTNNSSTQVTIGLETPLLIILNGPQDLVFVIKMDVRLYQTLDQLL
jgi:hypothetical protein